jgi:hypothetical protein
MIKEDLIDKMLMELEAADFQQELDEFKVKYPVVFSYLMNDQLASLTEEEFQLLFFDAIVIIKCFESVGTIPETIHPATLEDKESANWNLMQNSKPATFQEKLDVFFRETNQEDLLAFIEDSLSEDDEFVISSAAREIMFICLKSVLDLLDQPDN